MARKKLTRHERLHGVRCKVLRNKNYFVVLPYEPNCGSVNVAAKLARLAFYPQIKSARLSTRLVPICDVKYGTLQRRKGN